MYCEYCGQKGTPGKQCRNCGSQLHVVTKDNSGTVTWHGPVMTASDLKDAGEKIYTSFMETMLDMPGRGVGPGDTIEFKYTIKIVKE